jgi:hypothetical protein
MFNVAIETEPLLQGGIQANIRLISPRKKGKKATVSTALNHTALSPRPVLSTPNGKVGEEELSIKHLRGSGDKASWR